MTGEASQEVTGPLPPVILLIAILLMTALHVVVPGGQIFTGLWRLTGALPIAAGLILNIWADHLFERAGTSVKPFDPSVVLILNGPFRITRNPMYLGMTLVLTGVAIGLGSWLPWIVVPLFLRVITVRFITPEERKLKEAFGVPYVAYRARVRRWI